MLYLTPHRALASMYAREGGRRLVRKRDARWALTQGRAPRAEWEMFGADEGDNGVAAALCRKRTREGMWVSGLDGWIHAWSSPTLGEVMVCAPGDCLRMV